MPEQRHTQASEGDERGVRAADGRFFDALVRADDAALDHVLDDRFSLVDVMSGSVIPKVDLRQLVGSGQLVFGDIAVDADESFVRFLGSTALLVGHTRMAGRFEGAPFAVHSRYTHVFTLDATERERGWQLVGAQGTKTS